MFIVLPSAMMTSPGRWFGLHAPTQRAWMVVAPPAMACAAAGSPSIFDVTLTV
jgi:hypothetical protein